VTLSSGTRLGPYEVLSPLGAGGMGEVYRARDTRLDREVAIKVLPAELASDPERLKRFEKEARSASSLNHPNIVTIYDIGSEGGVSWIAMEKVEGTTLRELLVGGPLPIKRLFQIGPQIAEGLARAHEAGIVHRDLKPENVMVTKDGLVKILDFGLAKLGSRMSGSGEGSQLPTMTETTPGVVVGTVGYMSPEQASGVALDFRSDQFSLGSILYEMATGRRAFQKKTAIDTLAAILNEEPEGIGAINPQVPAPLRWIVERCLAKDPESRYASTKDLSRELAGVRDHFSEAGVSGAFPAPAAARRRPLLSSVAILAALAAGALMAALVGRSLWSTAPPRFRQLTFSSGSILTARFAPGGQTIVFGYQRGQGKLDILSTQPDSTESRSLGLPPGNILSVSRSGEIALLLGTNWERGTLARVALSGGAPREVLESARGADWLPDGSGLVVIHSVEGKNRVEFPIGQVLYETQERVVNPRFSPKGDLIAVGSGGTVLLLDSKGSRKPRPSGATSDLFAWSPSGEEIWFSEADRGVTTVSAVSLAGRKRRIVSLPGEFFLHDVSREGGLLMERNAWDPAMVGLLPGDANERDLTWLDASVPADISADGRLVLFTEAGPGGGPAHSVYVWKADDAQAVRLGEGTALALAPDGRWALATVPNSKTSLALIPTGPGEPRTLDLSSVHPLGTGNVMAPSAGTFFPDGKRVLVTGFEEGRGKRLYVVDLAGGKPRPIGPEGAFFTDGAHGVSPDGKYVAVFGPDETAHLFPVVGGADATAPPIPGAAKGEEVIRWCADGRSVFVIGENWNIHRLDIRTRRRELWKSFSNVNPSPNYVHPTPDGKWYVYGNYRTRSNLFLVDGVK
jgi:serine/threonine protein kinase/Tol biopolymer transport system component